NGLVAGSSPASPTTQSHANRDFPWFDEYLRFCGAQSRLAVSAGKKDRFRGSSGPSVSGNPKTVSPERGKERSETRFACDRDRFAVKSRSRRGSGRIDAYGSFDRTRPAYAIDRPLIRIEPDAAILHPDGVILLLFAHTRNTRLTRHRTLRGRIYHIKAAIRVLSPRSLPWVTGAGRYWQNAFRLISRSVTWKQPN